MKTKSYDHLQVVSTVTTAAAVTVAVTTTNPVSLISIFRGHHRLGHVQEVLSRNTCTSRAGWSELF